MVPADRSCGARLVPVLANVKCAATGIYQLKRMFTVFDLTRLHG